MERKITERNLATSPGSEPALPRSLPSGHCRAPRTGPLPSLRALAFAAVYVIWGSTYLAIRVGVATIQPLLLAGARSLVAGVVLLAWWLARGERVPTRVEWRRAAVSGVAMLAGGNGLVTLAETHIPSN